MTFVKTDSIIYKNGNPFQGKEVTIKHSTKLVQQYENGKAIHTEILDVYNNDVKAIVTYSDDGIITKTPSGKIISELIYLNEAKDKARVICYKDFKKVGTLTYDKNKITTIDLSFKEAGFDLKYYINKQGKVSIKAKNLTSSIIIQPSFEANKNFNFTDFLDVENLFTYTIEASADFYLDKMAAPISHCTVKKGKPYNGTIIRYNKDKRTYRYKKYKNGERVKKEKGLTKKQLIEILNK